MLPPLNSEKPPSEPLGDHIEPPNDAAAPVGVVDWPWLCPPYPGGTAVAGVTAVDVNDSSMLFTSSS